MQPDSPAWKRQACFSAHLSPMHFSPTARFLRKLPLTSHKASRLRSGRKCDTRKWLEPSDYKSPNSADAPNMTSHRKAFLARIPADAPATLHFTRLEKIAYRVQILVGAFALSMLALLGAIDFIAHVWRVL
jgi:hypothetical protein